MKDSLWLAIFRRLSFFLFISLLIGIIFLPLASAQEKGELRSEIASLRNELFSLRNQVSRLEREVNRLGSSSLSQSPPLPTRTAPPLQIVEGVPMGRSDPMFERLANLLIELKERVTSLEKRVNQLEKKS